MPIIFTDCLNPGDLIICDPAVHLSIGDCRAGEIGMFVEASHLEGFGTPVYTVLLNESTIKLLRSTLARNFSLYTPETEKQIKTWIKLGNSVMGYHDYALDLMKVAPNISYP